jgi:NAD kinase
MFRIGCFKAQPTEFVRKVAGGRVKREGQALSFCQSLLAFNDLFVGRKTHISARYHLTHGRRSENQSSSGIIVSTGGGPPAG